MDNELKKQRFLFLQQLYTESKGDTNTLFWAVPTCEKIGGNLSVLSGVLRYLESEGLIRIWKELIWNIHSWPEGLKNPIFITHKGIKEIEKAIEYPESSTQHFPPYQVINIEGNYIEIGRVLGDLFKEIHNATIINKSLVEGSFNKVSKDRDEETGKALVRVAEYIEKSGSVSAGALLDKFNEELTKTQPDKSKLSNLWSGIQSVLPTITSLAQAVLKVTELFT